MCAAVFDSICLSRSVITHPSYHLGALETSPLSVDSDVSNFLFPKTQHDVRNRTNDTRGGQISGAGVLMEPAVAGRLCNKYCKLLPLYMDNNI